MLVKIYLKTTLIVLKIILASSNITWSAWGPCSISCGGAGHQKRTARCDNAVSPRLTGNACKDGMVESRACISKSCPARNSTSSNNQTVTLKYTDGKLICVVNQNALTTSNNNNVNNVDNNVNNDNNNDNKIYWYKDNEDVTNSNMLINPNTLSLTHVKDNEEHEYTCRVGFNLTSEASDTMIIKRNKHSNPVIMKKHRSKSVTLDYDYENEKLKCVVKPTKSSDTNITWYKDSEEITNNDMIIDDVILDLSKIPDTEENDYSCEITSHEGSQFSQHLLISGKTYIGLDVPNSSQKFSVVKLDDNRTINFKAECLVRSYPTAELHFLKNEEIISPDDTSGRINITMVEQGKETLYQLYIRNISAEDIGEYHCLASNDYISKMIPVNAIIGDGKCSPTHHWKCPSSTRCLAKSICSNFKDCQLYYCTTPSEPKDIKVLDLTYNSAILTWWNDPRAMEFTIIADTDDSLSQAFQTQRNFLALADLKNNSEYSVTIYASNKRGMSREVYYSFKTKRMVPPEAIRNPTFIKNQGNESIVFRWDEPADDGMNKEGPLLYKTKYCLYGNSSCESVQTNLTSLDLSSVDHGQLYYVSVSAINLAGQEGKVSSMFYRTSNTSAGITINHGMMNTIQAGIVLLLTRLVMNYLV